MKLLKNEKYEAILLAARKEFISKGFKEASMRTIAKEAGVSLSNIYNYFTNKDALFQVIVRPAKEELFSFVKDQHTEEAFNFELQSTFSYQEKSIDIYIELIDRYREELHLLLYQSEGSSMKHFREEFTNHLDKVNEDYMTLIKEHYPHINEISAFFNRTLSSWMVSIVGDIITHKLSKNKIRDFFREFFRFEFSGWRELTGI